MRRTTFVVLGIIIFTFICYSKCETKSEPEAIPEAEDDVDDIIRNEKQETSIDEEEEIPRRKNSNDVDLEETREGMERLEFARAAKTPIKTKMPATIKSNTHDSDDDLIAMFGNIPKVIKDKCNDYPSLPVNSAASKPYIGIYIISDKHYIWMEKPKSALTHPEWEQTVELLPKPTIAAKMAPWDSFFISHRVFYIFKNQNLYKFSHIPRVAEDVQQIPPKTVLPLTALPTNAKANAIFEAMAGRDDSGGSYFVILYTLNGKQEMLMTKGNSTTKVPISFTWSGTPVSAIGLFDYRKVSEERLGFVAFGKHFQYFHLSISNTNANLKIVSPPMDNQVLFGCPQTFCFHSAIDAIATSETKIVIFRGIYYWEISTVSTYLTKSDAILLTNLRTQDDRNPFLTSTVEAAFTLSNTLYIIRKGRIYMGEKLKNVFRWRPYDAVFTDMAHSDWFGSMDAAFRSPTNPNNTFLIKGENYWYLTREDTDDFTSLNNYHISNLKGFPLHIEAAFYYEPDSKVYAFSGNYLFIHEKDDFSEGITTKDCQVQLVQDVFFACNQYHYENTGVYKSFADFKAQMVAFRAVAAQKEADSTWLYTTVGITFLLLIIVAIIVMFFLWRQKPPAAVGTDVGSKESVEDIPVASKASGFSISEELQDIINEKKAKKGNLSLTTRSSPIKSGSSKISPKKPAPVHKK